jgi:inner membrane transporter RhtA
MWATGLVAAGAGAAEVASALSVGAFATVGAETVGALRLVVAAIVLGVVFQPRLRRRPAEEWVAIIGFGIAMAGTSLALHAAIARVPLGIAVTIQFLGPCVVALAASRRLVEVLCAVMALAGVVVIAGPGGAFDAAGFALALLAAAFLALYTVLAEKVGKSAAATADLSLAVGVAALVALPFVGGGMARMTPGALGLIAVSAVLGVVVPYSADTLAARLSSARVIGTLFSLDPVMGLAMGWLILRQAVSPLAVTGVLVVVCAGGLLVWSGGQASSRRVGRATAGWPRIRRGAR